MDKNPLSKIYTLVRNLAVVKHKSRQEFLCSLLEGLIKSRSALFNDGGRVHVEELLYLIGTGEPRDLTCPSSTRNAGR